MRRFVGIALCLFAASTAWGQTGFRTGRAIVPRVPGRSYTSLLSTLPSTGSQCSGSLTGASVARAGVRTCLKDDGTAVALTTNQLAVEADGILIEQGVTNYYPRSQQFDDAAWSKQSSGTVPVVTADAFAAPDGTTTADQIDYKTAVPPGGWSDLRQNVTIAAGPYTCTAWLKSGTTAATNLRTAIGGGTGSTVSGLALTSSWASYGYSLTAGSGTTNASTRIGNDGGGAVTQALGTIGIWGFQFANGAYQHAYVPTAGASASSADDVVTVANPISGTTARLCIGMTFKPTYGRTWESRTTNIALWQAGTASTSSSAWVYWDTSTHKLVLTLQDASDGTRTFTTTSTITGTSSARFTYCHEPAGGKVYINGTQDSSTWNGSGTGVFAWPASLTLGRHGSTASTMLDGHVSNICIDSRMGHCL